ncbi:07c32c7f-00fb-40c6-a292-ac60dd246955 [Sclerotinia trifoliorum]|uniref:07c32c7f-00fb-40c6-a292-ac60dd246955 n=1 Tax=Sclerotinia trifoliorum TaxID=28548 RepID=A0A8H2VSU7_9HELO|nr:07c32c7f-00fb-40c6-a292-ac60dd246955 [Sclerotinia trifoliorum]
MTNEYYDTSSESDLLLKMKATIWRGLMAIGMKFHHFADPKPPAPNFKIRIPSRLCPRGGYFNLIFYVPQSYVEGSDEDRYRFPVVVNYHGGGFTLGTGTDDARWASAVIHTVDAVFVSVEYRLAPEYPFSVGVEDGTDAVMYLAAHAEELRLDPHRMALSGFSAGGNFAFTVPLMLHDLQNDAGKRTLADLTSATTNADGSPSKNASRQDLDKTKYESSTSAASSSTLTSHLRPNPYQGETQSRNQSTTSIAKIPSLEPTALEIAQEIPDLTIRAIVSFYPPTDFRQTRDEKRATNPAPEKNLPPMLTRLFDESYMHPIDSIDLRDPYLSPAAATDKFLREAYPQDIVLYTCEYDMLNVEGIAFGERLSSPAIGKSVKGGLINCVPHAFDKKPNPISFPEAADRCYEEACAELARVFGSGKTSEEDRRQLGKSKVVDRFEEQDKIVGVSDRARDLIDNTSLAEGRRESGMADNHGGVEGTGSMNMNGEGQKEREILRNFEKEADRVIKMNGGIEEEAVV